MPFKVNDFLKIPNGTVIDRFADPTAEVDPSLYYRTQSLRMLAWSLAKGLDSFADDSLGEIHMDRGISGYHVARTLVK